MRNSESRISGDMIYAKTIAFVNLCRALKETHFTRIRKMSLDNLMLSVLFRKGITLHFGIENFTGTKSILLEQDIYATIYLCNIMNDIMLEAQMELEQEVGHDGKHVMSINKNIAIGIMKEDLIHFILEKSDRKRKARMVAIVNEMKRNLLPIRKGRHYPRTKGVLAGKYSNSRKKSY